MAEQVTLSDLESKVPAKAGTTAELARIQIGGWIVFAIGVLIIVAGLFITLYAAASKPTLTDLKQAVPEADLFAAFKELRTAWFTEIKDLLQLTVVSLLVPALTTVIGYIFGRQEASTSEQEE